MQKKVTAILMMLTLLVSMSTVVFAKDINVSYEGDADKFVYIDGSDSIFDNLANIAPGESRTQKIKLTNNDREQMRFFMKTEATDELGDADAVFTITIVRDSTELYSGTIQGLTELSTGAMEDSLMLADLSKGEATEVVMTLEVDETLTNEYQDQSTSIRFVFGVDTPPENVGENKTVYKTDDKTVYKQGPTTVNRVVSTVSNIASRVKTGDSTTLGFYAGILVLGAMVIIGLVVYRKRKGSKEE